MGWTVLFHDDFVPEFEALAEAVQDELLAHTNVLEEFGPTLGRPHADTLVGSKHANMKELRFQADNGAWRVAFAFDPKRQAILLVAGNKAGVSQKRFYKKLISTADTRFLAWMDFLEGAWRMAKNLYDIMDGLPEARRARIDARAETLRAEVSGLQALRKLSGRTQEQLADSLGIKQPSVHKMEKQSDLYLSTLRRFVEAAGGTLEVVVNLPEHGELRLTGIAELSDTPS